MKILFIILILTGCSVSLSTFENDCQQFAQNYQSILDHQLLETPVFSWETMEQLHNRVTKNLINSKWSQNTQNIDAFSSFFFSLIRPRIWLVCGDEIKTSSPTLKKKVQPGVIKIIPDTTSQPTDFSLCLTNKWLESENLISQSCRSYFIE